METNDSLTWATSNLQVDSFRNGDPIAEARNDKEWQVANASGVAVWAHFDNNPESGAVYGKLYNWYAVNDPRGLAPAGWHIPTDQEWSNLGALHEGGTFAVLGGLRISVGERGGEGSFEGRGQQAVYWTATEADHSVGGVGSWKAWGRVLFAGRQNLQRYSYAKADGLSVRCVKD